MADLDFIALAGDRRPCDPLAQTNGVPGKALASVVDRPMLQYVLEVLAGLHGTGRIALVSPGADACREVVDAIPGLAVRVVLATVAAVWE